MKRDLTKPSCTNEKSEKLFLKKLFLTHSWDNGKNLEKRFNFPELVKKMKFELVSWIRKDYSVFYPSIKVTEELILVCRFENKLYRQIFLSTRHHLIRFTGRVVD